MERVPILETSKRNMSWNVYLGFDLKASLFHSTNITQHGAALNGFYALLFLNIDLHLNCFFFKGCKSAILNF